MFNQSIFLFLIILLVVSYNFNRFAICFQSFTNITCRRTQNASHIRCFWRLHIVLTSEFFILLKCNSFDVHCKFGACQKWEQAGRIGDFGNFLTGFAKSPRVLRWSWTLNERSLSWEIVKYCILSEVCTSSYSFTSDMMYKKYKRLVYRHPGLLARFCKIKLPNAKNLAWFVFQA